MPGSTRTCSHWAVGSGPRPTTSVRWARTGDCRRTCRGEEVAAGYQPWIDTLRQLLRHSALLRIDHVMGLFRLYCIPPGHDALDGAYVYSHGAELLDLAVMEAARAGAVLVGEDLGTVEPEVRDAMAERGVYGYAVGWFADEDPTTWPPRTVAMLGTHDLPTAAGLWDGTDAAD
ncbi:MAG TPA: 4-alpha-glucanotransferase, partial [Microthrixaceae bacterium]|nr:4-alpha-glucanotransferase [Microthrixaceae bacterium]